MATAAVPRELLAPVPRSLVTVLVVVVDGVWNRQLSGPEMSGLIFVRSQRQKEGFHDAQISEVSLNLCWRDSEVMNQPVCQPELRLG